MCKFLSIRNFALSIIIWFFVIHFSGFSFGQISLELQYQNSHPTIDQPFVIRITNRSETPVRIANPNAPLGHGKLKLRLFGKSSELVAEISPVADFQQYAEYWYRRTGDSRKYVYLRPEESTTTLVWLNKWPWRAKTLEKKAPVALIVSFDNDGTSLQSARTNFDTSILSMNSKSPSIFELIRERKSDAVIGRLEKNPELAEKLDHGINLLHAAAQANDIRTMKFLLKHGHLDINSISDHGFAALHYATAPNAISILLENDAKAELDSVDGTPVEIAARKLRQGRNSDQKEQWLEILNVYRSHYCQESSLRNAIALNAYEVVCSHDLQATSDSELQSIFESALDVGSFDICKYLIQKASVRLRHRPEARRIVFESVRRPEILKLLIDNGFPFDGAEFVKGGQPFEMPLLFHACVAGEVQSVRLLLEKTPDLRQALTFRIPIKKKTISLLDMAAASGSLEVYDLIFQSVKKCGLAKKSIDEMLELSLFRAVAHPDLLRHAIKYPTKISEERVLQLTQDALFWLRNADEHRAENLRSSIAVLIANGAGSDLLANVAVGNTKQIIRLLDHDKTLLLSLDENCSTILHNRLLLEQPELLELILGRADKTLVDQADGSGATCLHLACLQDLLETSLQIMKFKPNINKSDSYGRTALHHACLNCNVAMTKALLANGANAEAKDNDGNTPWDYAKNPNSATLTRKTHFRIIFPAGDGDR